MNSNTKETIIFSILSFVVSYLIGRYEDEIITFLKKLNK